jgi:hypothetical protein
MGYLTTFFAIVDDIPAAAGAVIAANLRSNKHQMSQELLGRGSFPELLRAQTELRDLDFRDDKNVRLRHGRNVAERQALLVLVHLIARNFAANDLSENGVARRIAWGRHAGLHSGSRCSAA